MAKSPFTQMTSRLGPGLKSVLALIAGVGLLEAVLVSWVGMKEAWVLLACVPEKVLHGQLWRLLTAGVLTDISHPMGLLFTLVGLYFLSPDLEKRWGTGRFLLFLALSTILGNALAIAVDLLAPQSLALLHPPLLYGASAALVGTAVAWGVYNRGQQVLLFMIMPVSGQTLIWITVGGCFLYLLYLGDVTSFGGLVTGLTMVGEPSVMRRAYLRLKLAMLRSRQGGGGGPFTADDIVRSKGPILRKGRAEKGDRPPLRVVQGGQGGPPDERGKASDPPKDKRYLN
jgi:membrane associated rhomboid family serine protease